MSGITHIDSTVKVDIFGTVRLATNQNRYTKRLFGTPLDYTYAHWQILDEISHWKKNFAWLLFCPKFDGFTLFDSKKFIPRKHIELDPTTLL